MISINLLRFLNYLAIKSKILTFRYDGQRAQIHQLHDGTVRVFSRNGDETTSRFPDLVGVIKQFASPAAETFMLDAEVGEFFILVTVMHLYLSKPLLPNARNDAKDLLPVYHDGHTWCIGSVCV